MKNSRGESLMELVVAIGLVVVIITALAITTLNGLKNSQYSQNQAQATKLAQESIEAVKTMKARNCDVRMSDGSVLKWYQDGSAATLIWSVNFPDKRYFRVNLSAGSCFLQEIALGAAAADPPPNNIFTRIVSLQGTTANIRNLTVEVVWDDYSGRHSSQVATILAQY